MYLEMQHKYQILTYGREEGCAGTLFQKTGKFALNKKPMC